jgi:hypothetical protein
MKRLSNKIMAHALSDTQRTFFKGILLFTLFSQLNIKFAIFGHKMYLFTLVFRLFQLNILERLSMQCSTDLVLIFGPSLSPL